MAKTPILTDRRALDAHRARMRANPALFLQEAAADDIQDRLLMVNRVFTAPAVVTPFPGIWAERMPDATCVADTEVLDLREGAHDLVIHALSLHWANDPVGQVIQCRRALKPDGLFLGVAFGGQTLTELRAALGQAEIEIAGGLSPRVAPMADIRDLGALLQRAGLALPVADAIPLRTSYRSALHLMQDLRAMGETNALDARLRHFTPGAVIRRAAELYDAANRTDDGRVTATYELVTLTGWAPDESQPRPLRPGSATASLADALGTRETKLSD
ncbi:methyltransferase domain-containing protein [Roseivivax sp. CAU 1753]